MAEEEIPPPPNMQRRILRDLQEVAEMENDFILIDADNMRFVKVVITGPPFSPFEGGLFELTLNLKKFPAKPPLIKFDTPVYHPNICPYEGKVCMNILNSDEWGPATRLKEVLEAVRSLLNQPNADSPLNGSAACMLKLNEPMYLETNQVWTHVFAGGDESRAPPRLIQRLNYVVRKLQISKAKAVKKLTEKEWDVTLVHRGSSFEDNYDQLPSE